jgi:hypothetical protein
MLEKYIESNQFEEESLFNLDSIGYEEVDKMVLGAIDDSLISKSEALDNIMLVGLERVEEVLENIENKKAGDNLTGKDIITAYEAINNVDRLLFGVDETLPGFEDVTIGYEALEGKTKSFLERLKKFFESAGRGILDLPKSFKSLGNLMAVDKRPKLKEMRKKIEELEKDKFVIDGKLAKMFAIYSNMYGDINAKNLEEFINIPVELFVNNKDIVKQASSIIIELAKGFKEGDPDKVKLPKASIYYVDKIKDPKIKEWLHKDALFVVMDRLWGTQLGITSLIMEKGKTPDGRYDMFGIKPTKDKFEISKKDLLTFIDVLIKTEPKRATIAKKYLHQIFSNIIPGLWEQLKTNLLAYIPIVGQVVALVRYYKFVTNIRIFMGGLKKTYLFQAESIYEATLIPERILKANTGEGK